MEGRYVIPQHPAGSHPLSIELYSQQNLNPESIKQLSDCLLTAVPKDRQIKTLILGARCGLTAKIMMPFCSHLDLVEVDDFKTLLEERFLNKKDIEYFFGKQGNIGQHQTAQKIDTGKTQIRVISVQEFCIQVHPHYDLVILQNCIITQKQNLVKELIKVQHDNLITMLVPGYILHKKFFPFVCALEEKVLNKYYERSFQQKVQNRKIITSRKSEIYFNEMYGWKKISKSQETQKQIHDILEEAETLITKTKIEKKGSNNPYETVKLVQHYLSLHFGPEVQGVDNYPAMCAKICLEKAKNYKVTGGRALDLGCALGRTSIDLAEYFNEVVGLDSSKPFIKAAKEHLQQKYQYQPIAKKVKFVTGNACNLNPCLGKFNLVFGGSLIDRLPEPTECLKTVCNFLQPNGVLILISPYSWVQLFTPADKWIGGYMQNGKPVTTSEGLARLLTKRGFKELCPAEEVKSMVQQNSWVSQQIVACATFWVKLA